MKAKLLVLAYALCTLVVQGFAPTTAAKPGRAPGRWIETNLRSTAVETDEVVEELLNIARKVGPVGSLASEEEREQVNEVAQRLKKVSGDAKPARAPLRGIHELVYSAAPGGSSGRLFGPVYGKVTQEFLDDDETFINAVRIGPVEISLQAQKIVKNDTTNIVKFKKSIVKLFGNIVVEKEIAGGGAWKYIYMGKVQGPDGKPRLLRVMETPSLFIIEQPVDE